MQLKCKHCAHISKSLLIDKDKAIAEVILDFSKHLISPIHNGKGDGTPFKLWMQDCTMLTQTVPTVVMIAKHTTLLDEGLEVDDYIQEKFSKLIDQLEEFLGVEVFDNKPTTLDNSKLGPQVEEEIPITEEEIKDYPGTDLTLPHMS